MLAPPPPPPRLDPLARASYEELGTVRVWNRGRFLNPAANVPVHKYATTDGDMMWVRHVNRGTTAAPQPGSEITDAGGTVWVVTTAVMDRSYVRCRVKKKP